MANETNETKYDIELDEDTQSKLDSNREADLNEVDNMYGEYDEATGTFKGGIGGQIDTVTNQQIQNIGNYAEQQKQIQQDSYNQQKAEINQQIEQTGKDYIKEGAGAYADYQKAINPYGVNAERMAEQGHTGSGVAESSRITMYTTYQNRVATARKVYSDAVVNFNNMLEQARIANNSAIAQIGFQAMQSQFEISMNALNKKGELVDKIASQKMAVNARHDNLYQIELDKLYRDASLNEEARQFDENHALEREKWDWTKIFEEGKFDWQKTVDGWKNTLENSIFNWQKTTDERDYNRGVTESDRNYGLQEKQVNATIRQNAQEEIFNLVNNGAGEKITNEMLTNAGWSSDTVTALTSTYKELKASAKSDADWAKKKDLIALAFEGGYVSDEDLASIGIEAGSNEYKEFKDFVETIENSAILETGGAVTTDGYDWSSVSNSVGFKMDNNLKEALIKAGLFTKTETTSGRKLIEIADHTALDFVNMAVARGKDAEIAMEYYNSNLKELSVTWDGGINWWGGLDENAEVTDKNGKKHTLKELRKSLIPILGEDGAEKFARKLQNELGISESK